MITSMAVGNLTCGTLCAATTFKHSGQEKSFICSVTLIEWGNSQENLFYTKNLYNIEK